MSKQFCSLIKCTCLPRSRRLYMLVGDFFDKQEDIVFEASGVKDITSFASQGNHYIVFGMENSVSDVNVACFITLFI